MIDQDILSVPGSLDTGAIEALKVNLRGQLLFPGEDGYDQARTLWNGMIDKRPALIIRCAGASDVIQAVNFAREHKLLVSVKGGGHNVAGNAVCNDGLMIDLSSMRSIRIDPVKRIARAEAGALWSDMDHEAQAFGLATTGGTVSHTGIAGLTLGGGQGWLMCKYGLTCDNLLSVDIITADGRFLTASDTENEDLFWAVRGGGGNFGIVTSFEYRLHPVGPNILGGMMLYPIHQAKEVFRFYRDYSMSTPKELGVIAGLLNLPDGTLAVAIVAGWIGPLYEGGNVLKPLRDFGSPIADMIAEMPYTQLQSIFDAAVPHGMHRYLKMGYIPQIDDEFIEITIKHTMRKPSPYSIVLFNCIKGAVTKVDPKQTPFVHRNEAWHFEIFSQWTDSAEAEQNISWVRNFWHETEPFTRGVGVNFLDADDVADRVRLAYGANYDRLVSLKRKYDPNNFFRLNNNINPANAE